MAAGGDGREAAAWFAVSRRLVWLAAGVVFLLVLGCAAALIVDAIEVTGPQLPFSDPCNQGSRNVYLSASSSAAGPCQWNAALSRDFNRKVLLQVTEAESGAFTATATLTTVTADPLVAMVQHGDGQDANTFFGDVLGSIGVGNYGFTWSVPTVAVKSTGTAAIISTTGKPFTYQSPIPGAVELIVSADSPLTTLQVNTGSRVIAGVSEDDHGQPVTIASESAHSLTADHLVGQLSISLQPGSPQPFSSPPEEAGANWVARISSTVWGLLSGFTGLLVPAGAWIGVLLASRMGAFGAIGRRIPWRRMEQVLAAVVIAHLVISACSQFLATEADLTSSLLDSASVQIGLSHFMIGAGLWATNGFPAVYGGVIMLIAFAFIAGLWGLQDRKRLLPPRRRIAAPLAVAAGAVAAVTSYAALAGASAEPVFGDGLQPGSVAPLGGPPLAVEVPLAILCTLIVLFLAASRICGALSARLEPAGTLPGRGSQKPARGRAAVGGVSLATAAALTWAGLAVAMAYRGDPVTVDAVTLWGAGSLVTLIVTYVFAALAFPLMVPAAGKEPRPQTRARVLIGSLLMAAAVLGLPFYVIPHLVSWDFTGGSRGQFSGRAVLFACLALAAVLVAAAVFASYPRRAGRSLDRHYWIVPLVAVLAITASLTNAYGYVPVALRWGVLIAAGTFLGMAVIRLIAAGVGPLRDPTGRMPHLRAAILVAAVSAVPWSDLGAGPPIGWWNLIEYTNRIDSVLPLVLVAAGVTALRRLGLSPSRDEITLSAHRSLGITAWIVALSGSYTFGGTGNLADAATLATAAVAAWFLMPRDQVRRASAVLCQSEQEASEAVRRAVETGVARRTLPGLAKTMRDQVAGGTATFAQAQEKVTALERRAASGAAVRLDRRRNLKIGRDQQAFGSSVSPRPWERACLGAGYALIAGAPWVLLGLAGASVPLDNPEGYPELALISAVAPLVLRWVGYGLLFGYFFPLLRGRTGLGKGMSFFTAAAAPSILSTLTSPHPANQQWHSATLLALQLLIFALSMGLLADLAVLRRNGFAAGRLVDLHSLWTVSAWASSIVVAVGTGIATIILAGLQPFVIGVITPSTPSTPPASVSHP